MRYFLTLPFAALALAATPAMAQDTATPPETATTQTPPTDPMAQPTATPPADPAAPASTDPAAPTPAETVESAPPAATTTAPASAPTGLTAEQQAAYDAWPAGTKSYFDALTPTRQQLFLRVTDNDKAKLVALPADQQETVWASLETQAAAQAPAQPMGN